MPRPCSIASVGNDGFVTYRWANACDHSDGYREQVRICRLGADRFDPESSPELHRPAEETFAFGENAGSVQENIVFDSKLDPNFFDFTTPPGFEVVHEKPIPPVTEEELIEWLDVTAQFNDGLFVDSGRGVDASKHSQGHRSQRPPAAGP